MDEDFAKLPEDLVKPLNDGACDHLLGITIPKIPLESTKNRLFDVNLINTRYVILYFFPMMAIPGKKLPNRWDQIPGARGCTPQNLQINEQKKSFQKYNAMPVGVSTQPVDELIKLSLVRGFSQDLLSDTGLKFHRKLQIPIFKLDNKTFYKRLTLVLEDSKIVKIFYPVFPPDKHPLVILNWLKKNSDDKI